MNRFNNLTSLIKRIFDDVNNEGYDQIQVNCPRCAEESGSYEADGKFNLEINLDKHVFRCWKCDEPKFSGKLEYLIKLYGNLDDRKEYQEYKEDTFEYNHSEKKEEVQIVTLPDEFISFASIDSNNPDHMNAYNYLILKRKIDREVILKHRLGFCVDGRFKNRIIIPSFDANGRINYFVARTWVDGLKPTYMNPKVNKSSIIYNEGFINWDATVYVVEGGFEELSFPVNTIPLLGKVIGDKLFFKLKELKPSIVVVLDPDAIKDAIKLYEQIQSIYFDCLDRVKIVLLKGTFDLDEIKRFKNIEGVKEVIKEARHLEDVDYLYLRK